MRILFNGYAKPGVGGPQCHASGFQVALRARGFDAVGIVLRRALDGAEQPSRIETPSGPMHQHFLDLATNEALRRPEPGLPPAVEAAAERVVEILSSEAPDALILNGFSLANAYLAHAAERLNIPFYFSHHGFWFAEIPAALPLAAQARMRAMESEAIRAARANVYLNAWSRERVEEAYPGSRRQDDVVIPLPYNPVFLNEAAPSIASDDRATVGFVARWDPIKNIGLMRAFAQAAMDVRVLAPIEIGGRKSLAAEEDAFPSVVQIMPPLPQEALPGFYRSCDLMVLPSRFDVSPTVVMEAALQGRGTVISDRVGWVETYERLGMEDWIVRDPSPERLETAVRRCLGKPVPKRFRDEVLDHHHPDRVFDAWASLLTSNV
ncbi:MAG: glycosyltransferase family 4 protein [Patescibacteria group bacterium]|nr:MAG: glycosyltransferase family 4 protein [Patescibacteria group bacterium]